MIGLVLAGGPVRPSRRLLDSVSECGVIVAADGGLRHAATLGVVPDLLIGDMDSVPAADLERWSRVPREVHPADKDALDLELAIEAARARGASEIRVVGAFGGRFDQALAATLVAARHAREGLGIAMLDGIHDAHPVAAGGRFARPLPAGTVFSLLAIGDTARVDVAGAAYELTDEPLPMGVGRGLSNRAKGGPSVAVREGLVLVIVEWEA